MTMASAGAPRAFAVWWKDVDRWDVLSIWLRTGFEVSHELCLVSDVMKVRWQQATNDELTNGSVLMVDRVSFDGEIFCGSKQETKMEQFVAKPGDLVVSKIRARQGSIGLVEPQQCPVSVTIHYRVLIPDTQRIDRHYAWLALRSSYCRAQFLAATGGAMKGEISEEALLTIKIPLPPLAEQTAIVARWRKAQYLVEHALSELKAVSAELDEVLHSITNFRSLETPMLVLHWQNLGQWDVKSSRAAAFRIANPSFVPLSHYAEEATEMVKPWLEPEKEWPVYGVNNKEGVFFSHFQKGFEFNAPYKRIRKAWFFHNPTRSSVGSLGIVPDVPDDAITSPEYQVWRLRPGSEWPVEFVAALVRTTWFVKLIQVHRVGAVKQRLYVENLLSMPMPIVHSDIRQKAAMQRQAALLKLADARQATESAKAEVEALILGIKSLEDV